jgi:hypothetical protein
MSKEKVKEIVEKFQKDKGEAQTLVVPTKEGPLEIARMQVKEVSGFSFLEIYLADTTSDPHYRIMNPPLYYEDPTGDVEIPGSSKKYRRDPLRAVAEVIAGHKR